MSEIWRSAQRNKLRTALTGFAVAWGIFMLVVLLGAGNGLINAQLKQNSRFLTNSIVVFGGETSKPYQGLKEGRRISLEERDITTTANQFKEHIDEVGAMYETVTNISRGDLYLNTTVAGVYPNHPKIDKVELLRGRFINQHDINEKRKVLVLSNKQEQELIGKDASLVGQYVDVGNFAFQVVGIYKDNENGRASAYSSYSAIKSIYGSKDPDEFTFHGLTTEAANDAFEKDYRNDSILTTVLILRTRVPYGYGTVSDRVCRWRWASASSVLPYGS